MIAVSNPVDGSVVGEVAEDCHEAVAAVVRRLREAQPAWQELGVEGRAKWLHAFRDWLMDNEVKLTALIQREAGKVRGDAAIETTYGALVLNYYVDHAAEFLAEERPRPAHVSQLTKRLATVYHPYPLVGVISP